MSDGFWKDAVNRRSKNLAMMTPFFDLEANKAHVDMSPYDMHLVCSVVMEAIVGEIGADDRWILFVDALRQADAAGVIVLPAKSGKGWLRYADPILPAWIKLPPEVAQTDSFDHRSFGWCRQLTFLAKDRLLKRSVRNSALEIQRFFAHEGESRPIVPVKERSYSIFGDEKKLDEIAETATLFGPGRLTLEELRCQVVEPTPVTARFARGTGVLVVENEATFDSFCRLCRHRDTFAMVVYGRGNEILKCTAFLRKTAAEFGALAIHYFGDVDRRGLSIAAELAALLAPSLQLLPHQAGYEFILTDTDAAPSTDAGHFEWLGLELARKASCVVARQSAVPQERFGWEQICSVYAIDPTKS